MKNSIIGILGEAGSGKDQTAQYLIEDHGYYAIALADPLKVYCGWMFGWEPEQLWGGGTIKNAKSDITFYRCPSCSVPGRPEETYNDQLVLCCHSCGFSNNHYESWKEALSPRFALQSLGGWGRSIVPDVYLKFALKRAQQVLDGAPACDSFRYVIPEEVLRTRLRTSNTTEPVSGIVITDVRYRNEAEGIKAAGGKVIRVKRNARGDVTSSGIPGHHSETEQASIQDQELDFVINNNMSLDELRMSVSGVVNALARKKCSCFHAPEQHGPDGCEATSPFVGPCPCKAAR
jgi:hypothetical protein